MTQRAGSATYHIFTAGTSAVFLALFVGLSELGFRKPEAWDGSLAARAASSLLGLRSSGDALVFRSHVFEVLGENALAVYIMGDQVGNAIGAMIPDDAPSWYFLCFGEVFYVGVIYVCTSYLRSHKLFLRL
jgi:hypothetical protein